MCQLACDIWQPWPELEEPGQADGTQEAQLLERYLAGDSFTRLNLWMQHRDMRRVFHRAGGDFD